MKTQIQNWSNLIIIVIAYIYFESCRNKLTASSNLLIWQFFPWWKFRMELIIKLEGFDNKNYVLNNKIISTEQGWPVDFCHIGFNYWSIRNSFDCVTEKQQPKISASHSYYSVPSSYYNPGSQPWFGNHNLSTFIKRS